MPYSVEVSEEAEEALAGLDKTIIKQIEKKIGWIAAHADEIIHEALTGNWQGFYKYRVNKYRIIYQFDSEQKLIFIRRIAHRQEVYED